MEQTLSDIAQTIKDEYNIKTFVDERKNEITLHGWRSGEAATWKQAKYLYYEIPNASGAPYYSKYCKTNKWFISKCIDICKKWPDVNFYIEF